MNINQNINYKSFNAPSFQAIKLQREEFYQFKKSLGSYINAPASQLEKAEQNIINLVQKHLNNEIAQQSKIQINIVNYTQRVMSNFRSLLKIFRNEKLTTKLFYTELNNMLEKTSTINTSKFNQIDKSNIDFNEEEINLIKNYIYGDTKLNIIKKMNIDLNDYTSKIINIIFKINENFEKLPKENRKLAGRFMAIYEGRDLSEVDLKIIKRTLDGTSRIDIAKDLGYTLHDFINKRDSITSKINKNIDQFPLKIKTLAENFLSSQVVSKGKNLNSNEKKYLEFYINNKTTGQIIKEMNLSRDDVNAIRQSAWFKIDNYLENFSPENKALVEKCINIKNKKEINNVNENIKLFQCLIKGMTFDEIAHKLKLHKKSIFLRRDKYMKINSENRKELPPELNKVIDEYKEIIAKKEQKEFELQKAVLEGLIAGKMQKEIYTDLGLKKQKIIQMKKDFLGEERKRKKFAPEIKELIVEYKIKLKSNTFKNEATKNETINDESLGIKGYAKNLIKKHNLNLEIEDDRKDLYKKILTYLVQSHFFEEIADNASLANLIKKHQKEICMFEIPDSEYRKEFIEYANELFATTPGKLKAYFNIKI